MQHQAGTHTSVCTRQYHQNMKIYQIDEFLESVVEKLLAFKIHLFLPNDKQFQY